MTRLFLFALMVFLALPTIVSASLVDRGFETIRINSDYITMQNEPFIKKDKVYYSLRELCDLVGVECTWNASEHSIGLSFGTVKTKVWIDSTRLIGDCCSLDEGHEPILLEGKTYITLQAFCKAMQFSYDDPFSFQHWGLTR